MPPAAPAISAAHHRSSARNTARRHRPAPLLACGNLRGHAPGNEEVGKGLVAGRLRLDPVEPTGEDVDYEHGADDQASHLEGRGPAEEHRVVLQRPAGRPSFTARGQTQQSTRARARTQTSARSLILP